MKSSILMSALFLVSHAAMATTFQSTTHYYSNLHFSRHAFGKDVEAVYAHVGVLQKSPDWQGGRAWWESVQHIPMSRIGNHFFAKSKHIGRSQHQSTYASGVVVQYWIYFADGSQMQTVAELLPQSDFGTFVETSEPNKAFIEERKKLEERFEFTVDANRSETYTITIGTVQ